MMKWRREVSWQWRRWRAKAQARPGLQQAMEILLLAGIVAFGVEMWTGAGLSGLWMRQQLETRGVYNSQFPALLALGVYAGIPVGLVTLVHAPGRRGMWTTHLLMWVLAGLFPGLCLLALAMRLSAPAIEGKGELLELGNASGPQRERLVAPWGRLRWKERLEYESVGVIGRGPTTKTVRRHELLVPAGQEGEKVRFLVALKETPGQSLPEGVLLRNSLPWFVRSTLERRGVQFADEYFVVHEDRYGATRGNWDAMLFWTGIPSLVMVPGLLWLEWQRRRVRR